MSVFTEREERLIELVESLISSARHVSLHAAGVDVPEALALALENLEADDDNAAEMLEQIRGEMA